MPLIVDQLMPSGTRVWVWNLTETDCELKKFLRTEDFDRIRQTATHPRRRMQKMVSRLLLDQLGGGKPVEWYYSENGKPKFRDFPGYFSLSHSHHFVGLAYHPLLSCGIDLEEIREKILWIAPRFTHEEEWAWVRQSEKLRDLTLIWSIKEALFKTLGGGGIHFKSDLRIAAPEREHKNSGKGTAVYLAAGSMSRFDYFYRYLEGVLLVHTIALESQT